MLSSNQFYATAALAYDTAYIGGTGGGIYAFDLSNGGLRWSFATGGYVYSSPAVWRDLVFEGSYDDYFYALNAASGKLVWRFYAGAPSRARPPCWTASSTSRASPVAPGASTCARGTSCGASPTASTRRSPPIADPVPERLPHALRARAQTLDGMTRRRLTQTDGAGSSVERSDDRQLGARRARRGRAGPPPGAIEQHGAGQPAPSAPSTSSSRCRPTMTVSPAAAPRRASAAAKCSAPA